MKTRDLLTPIGIFLGFVFIFTAIFLAGGTKALSGFFSLSSILIVLGGISASLVVGFGASEIKNMFVVVKQTFSRKEIDIQELIDYFIDLLRGASERGMLLGLEDRINRFQDPFIKKGVSLIVDGLKPEAIQHILEIEIDALEKRHARGYEMIYKAGEAAPAWGMVGTIIGLVIMLLQLDDPSSLGPGIAFALLTTFYGIVLSQLVFHPIADKLAKQSQDEVFMKRVIIEGILSVRNGENALVLREKLGSFMTDEAHSRLLEIGMKNGESLHEKG